MINLRQSSHFILAAFLLCSGGFSKAIEQGDASNVSEIQLTQEEIDEINKYHPKEVEKYYNFLIAKAACDELLPGFYSDTYIDYLSWESKHKTLVGAIFRWEEYTSVVEEMKSQRPEKPYGYDLGELCGRTASNLKELLREP